jgi:hypothetical protein
MVGSGIGSAPQTQAAAVPSQVQVTPSAVSGAAPVVIPKHKNGRLVFAHYHPGFPTSLDNLPAARDYYQTQYLNPKGEGGKWSKTGGYLRDRPMAVAPKAGDFRLANAKKEIADAKAAGIDGFALDFGCVKSSPPGTACNGQWAAQQAIFGAAAQMNFKIMLQPDMNTDLGKMSQSKFASAIAALAKNRAVYKRGGKVVVTPFMTERHSASWWKGALAKLKAKKVKVYFMPQFLQLKSIRTSKTKAAWDKLAAGYSEWGGRTPYVDDSPASALHKAKKIWMHPVAVQDARPKEGGYWEAANSATLRATWMSAIKSKADLVMLLTWNDYSEGTSFAPSLRHGYSLLDLNSYYVSWYRTGKAPKIARETVFISHRVHSYRLKPTLGYAVQMKPQQNSKPRDTIEVVTMLKKPAIVRVVVGSTLYAKYTAKASVYVRVVALRTGLITAQLVRSGTTLGRASTGEPVVSSRPVQDMDYRFASSRRPVPQI